LGTRYCEVEDASRLPLPSWEKAREREPEKETPCSPSPVSSPLKGNAVKLSQAVIASCPERVALSVEAETGYSVIPAQAGIPGREILFPSSVAKSLLSFL
jgi:hypothetical protein